LGHKRKYGDRRDWHPSTSLDYTQMAICEDDFDGHITLCRMNAVKDPLFVPNFGRMLCIADSGYSWLHQIPRHGHHVVTAMFDARGEIIQWYIDICSKTGIGDDHVPWFDDLYLDWVVLPTGEMELLEADELQEALNDSIIDQALFDLAWKEADHLQGLLASGELRQLSNSHVHREWLLRQMEVSF
jgi:uncharacterized protein